MKKYDAVSLQMKKPLHIKGQTDDVVYRATFLNYEKCKECLYVILQSGKLEDLSLDAIYECTIQSTKESLSCTGRIKERFCSQDGKIVKIQIENGFYKINIK